MKRTHAILDRIATRDAVSRGVAGTPTERRLFELVDELRAALGEDAAERAAERTMINAAWAAGFRAGRDASVARVLAVADVRESKLRGRRAGLVTTAVRNLAHILREIEPPAGASEAP